MISRIGSRPVINFLCLLPLTLARTPSLPRTRLSSLLPSGFSYHEGDAADPRMTDTARRRGVDLTSRSRPLRPQERARARGRNGRSCGSEGRVGDGERARPVCCGVGGDGSEGQETGRQDEPRRAGAPEVWEVEGRRGLGGWGAGTLRTHAAARPGRRGRISRAVAVARAESRRVKWLEVPRNAARACVFI